MRSRNNITVVPGERFGMLVVVEELTKEKLRGERRFLCKCDCGNECSRTLGRMRYSVKNYGGTSCGCVKRKNASKEPRKHFVKDPKADAIARGLFKPSKWRPMLSVAI